MFYKPVICPVCQKSFFPSDLHSYKIYDGTKSKFVCSYGCVIAHERKNISKREIDRKKRIEMQLMGML